jgi:integrase
MHGFRHGRVGHMQASGMPADFVKNQIGHSSLRITRRYTHFEHKRKRALAEQLLFCTQGGMSGVLYLMAKQPKVL